MTKILTILLLIISFHLYSSNNSSNETLFYIEIEIRSKFEHPVVISGTMETINFSTLSLENKEELIISFYKSAYFIPSFFVYDDIIDNLEKKNDPKSKSGIEYMNLININSRKLKLKTDNGKTVIIRITKIIGHFLYINKNDIDVPKISNGISPDLINEVIIICIPEEITNFCKVRKIDLKKIKSQING